MPCASQRVQRHLRTYGLEQESTDDHQWVFQSVERTLSPPSEQSVYHYARSRNSSRVSAAVSLRSKGREAGTRAHDWKCFAPEFIKRHAAQVGKAIENDQKIRTKHARHRDSNKASR